MLTNKRYGAEIQGVSRIFEKTYSIDLCGAIISIYVAT